MRQKKYINVLIVLGASLAFVILWFTGLDYLYAQLLRFGANVLLVFSSDTHVGLKLAEGAPTFVVETIIDGRKGSYPQKADLILLPFIMILTWQVLLWFNLPRRDALRSMWENLLIFYVIQVIYVLLLTGYYNSATIKFFYDLLMDSFYILALFLIIKDAFRYELFHFARRRNP